MPKSSRPAAPPRLDIPYRLRRNRKVQGAYVRQR